MPVQFTAERHTHLGIQSTQNEARKWVDITRYELITQACWSYKCHHNEHLKLEALL